MTLARNLGISALALGIAAPFAGSAHRQAAGKLDLDAVARAISEGSDHVSARQLAAWIRDGKKGLRVIDVRPAAAFREYAIPTAENVPVEQIARARLAPDQTIVLYSQEGAHAGQAWVMLRARGVTNAVFIPGGLADWEEEVMRPALGPDLTPERRAEISELSRYFGGSPRIDDTAAADGPEAAELTVSRRRGC